MLTAPVHYSRGNGGDQPIRLAHTIHGTIVGRLAYNPTARRLFFGLYKTATRHAVGVTE